jgi:hypothetical protein
LAAWAIHARRESRGENPSPAIVKQVMTKTAVPTVDLFGRAYAAWEAGAGVARIDRILAAIDALGDPMELGSPAERAVKAMKSSVAEYRRESESSKTERLAAALRPAEVSSLSRNALTRALTAPGPRAKEFAMSGADGLPAAWEGRESRGVTAEQAHDLEHEFLSRVERRFYAVGTVVHPNSGKTFSIDVRGEHRGGGDNRDDIRDRLRELGTFSRDALNRMPHNAYRVLDVVRGGLLSKKTREVSFIAHCLSPIDDLVRTGASERPMGLRDVEAILDEIPAGEPTYRFVGLYSPTGWEKGTADALEREEWREVGLVTRTPGGIYRVEGRRGLTSEALSTVFGTAGVRDDKPVTAGEMKIDFKTYQPLSVPGGFVVLRDIAEELNISEAQAASAAKLWASAHSDFTVEAVGGETILKRRRF